jgi:prephenate dehydrogenase
VEALWRSLGASTIRETPEAHDRVVAAVSHLPHALAFALSLTAAELCAPGGDLGAGAERARRFAGPSFEGATRFAGSDPALWRELFALNASNVVEGLAVVRARLDDIIQALQREGSDRAGLSPTLLDLLRQARALHVANSEGGTSS